MIVELARLPASQCPADILDLRSEVFRRTSAAANYGPHKVSVGSVDVLAAVLACGWSLGPPRYVVQATNSYTERQGGRADVQLRAIQS